MAALNPERLRVLVIEDDPSYRNLAREGLSGHERWLAATAREGLELFHLHQPHITFLDLSLPDESGMQILLEMRAHDPEAYVVMLTASRMSEDVILAQRCAANGYITKPFSRKQMQGYCEGCVRHFEKLEVMPAAERVALRAQLREDAAKMQTILHAPTPEAQAALQELMPRWRILVVGKEGGQAKRWQATLQAAGCRTDFCESGVKAIEAISAAPFRLVLVEDGLPDMDAAELLYRLRLNQLQATAVVVVDDEWKLRQTKWRKVGATHVVLGPLDDGKVRALVERQIARSLHEVNEIFLQM